MLQSLLLYHFLKGLSGSPIQSIAKACAFCLIFICGAWLGQIQWTTPKGNTVSVALVQTAISQKEKANIHTQDERLASLVSYSQPFVGNVQLIVWPETVVTYAKHKLNRVLSAFNETTLANKSTLLLGAYEKTYYGTLLNTAYTLGYEGGQSYSKRHLVPFGEYVPTWLWFVDDVVPGDQRRKLGQDTTLIANSGALFGVSICWEGSFSRDNNSLVRVGAQALINIANEAWFAHSTLPEQNLTAMQLRALETGRPSLRVANFGPSAIIDHNGRISHQFGADRPGGISGEIQPMQGITPFVFIGADFIMLSAFTVCCLIAIFQWRKSTDLAERPGITYQEMTLATILLIVLVSIAIPRFSNLTSAPAETTSNSQPTNLGLGRPKSS